MRSKLMLLVLLCSLQAFAAFERTHHGSRSTAMGGSLVAMSNNAWSAFINPAGMKTLTRTLSLGYAPQIFEMKEFSHASASFVEPTSVGAFALSASRFGFELYKETRISFSYAEELAGIVKGGVTVNYYSLSIQNYGSASAIGLDVGLLIDIADNVTWGFAAMNVNAPRIGSAKEKLPQVFSTGLVYCPIKGGTISASVIKDVHFPVELHIGVEYGVLDVIALRAGTTSDPSTLNAGIGIEYSLAKLDYAFTSHTELGITHQFSLSLNFGDL